MFQELCYLKLFVPAIRTEESYTCTTTARLGKGEMSIKTRGKTNQISVVIVAGNACVRSMSKFNLRANALF